MTDTGPDGRIPAGPGRASWWAGPLALLFGGLLAAALFIAFSGRGEFGDEGSFCTIAQGILSGRLPYRDLFNEKPPLQYFWTAAVMAFGGPTLAGARIASSIALALTAGCIVLGPLQRRASGLVVAGLMAATAVIAIGLEAYRNTADSTLALLFALSAALMARGPRRAGGAMLLGALYGLALGFRQTALAPALALLISPRLTRGRAAFMTGLMAGLLAWLAPLAATGTLMDFVRATLLFHIGNPGATSYVNHSIGHGVGIFAWVLVLAAVAVASGRSRNERVWVLCWLLAAALAYLGRMEAFRLWPSAAAALAILAWDERIGSGRALALGARVAGVLAVAALVAGASAFYRPALRHGGTDAVADALRRVSRPQDEVWAGPFAPYVYCLSERRPASRYYFVLPWTDKAEVRRQIVRDILTKRPFLVIDRSRAFDVDKLLPEFDPILRAHYRPVVPDGATSLGRFTIYRPTPPATPSSR